MSTMALQRGSDSLDGVQVGRYLLLAPARSIKLALFSSQHCPGPLALLERSFCCLSPQTCAFHRWYLLPQAGTSAILIQLLQVPRFWTPAPGEERKGDENLAPHLALLSL